MGQTHQPRNLLVTGGAGFIGVNFVRQVLAEQPGVKVVVYDALTYAGNPLSLEDLAAKYAGRYAFVRGNVCSVAEVEAALRAHDIDSVAHFAAESHVDRSIDGPKAFIESNILGTFELLQACRKVWQGRTDVRLHHVSTDEVYGSLGKDGYFTETTPYDPSSPYSASKAASDHLVRAWHRTFGLPVTISNCSNNYGPYQFPEKLIPLMIMNALDGKELPVYGDGSNVRDWLYVADHARAVWAVLSQGKPGRTYNVGGGAEMSNLEVVRQLCREVASATGRAVADVEKLITFVKDRPGHDWRYAIDSSRLRGELGWKPRETFASGLSATVRWYLDNPRWIAQVRDGSYREWLEKNYAARG